MSIYRPVPSRDVVHEILREQAGGDALSSEEGEHMVFTLLVEGSSLYVATVAQWGMYRPIDWWWQE